MYSISEQQVCTDLYVLFTRCKKTIVFFTAGDSNVLFTVSMINCFLKIFLIICVNVGTLLSYSIHRYAASFFVLLTSC